MQTIERVMVLCTGNICRSPMAAAVLDAGLRQRGVPVQVDSTGLGALGGHPADPEAVKLMDERGIDIRAHRGVQFAGAAGLERDLLLVMESEQQQMLEQNWPLLHGRVYRLGHFGNFEVDDPFQRGEKAFRKALNSIDTGVARWLEIIAG